MGGKPVTVPRRSGSLIGPTGSVVQRLLRKVSELPPWGAHAEARLRDRMTGAGYDLRPRSLLLALQTETRGRGPGNAERGQWPTQKGWRMPGAIFGVQVRKDLLRASMIARPAAASTISELGCLGENLVSANAHPAPDVVVQPVGSPVTCRLARSMVKCF